MFVAVDFDDTVVSQAGRDYGDVTTPLRFMPGAREGLAALKRAGHTIILSSARANRAIRENPRLDPLVRAGSRRVNWNDWPAIQKVAEARYRQMVEFVDRQLAGLIDAIDDGQVGKVTADLYIDDKALRVGHGVTAMNWRLIATTFGQPVVGSLEGNGHDKS